MALSCFLVQTKSTPSPLRTTLSQQLLGLLDLAEGLLEVDDVDARALGEDEAPHLRVPPARLVAEMDAGFEQVLQLGLCHAGVVIQSVLRVGRPPRSSPALTPRGTHAGSRGVRDGALTLLRGRYRANRTAPARSLARMTPRYRLLNWNRFRAPGRPGFLRSTARGSRVMSPAARSLRPVLSIGLDQRPSDREPERAGLARLAAAVHVGLHVEGAQRVGGGEGLLDVLHQRRPREVVAQRPAVDVPFAGAGGQIDPRHARLAAAHGLPAELGCRRSCAHLRGVTENGFGCCAACGCSAPA